MLVTKTVQIQVVSHKQELRETLDQFVKALNYASEYTHQHHIRSAFKLQKKIYQDLRQYYKLKSQMAINCMRRVVGTYKAKKNGTLATFEERSMTLNYPRDYRLIGKDLISLNTIYGRRKVTFQAGIYQQQYLNSEDWAIRSANLIERRDGKLFLQVAIEKELPDLDPNQCDSVIGVDIGINYIAVTSDTANQSYFYGGGRLKYTRWKYFKLRQELQHKGTRSAKRKLKTMSGRERRFVTDINHCISKKIVQNARTKFKNPVIVLEDLKRIRNTAKCNSKKGKRNLNQWSFYQLQQFIAYKAAELEISVVYIPPHYTSQQCPMCGHIEEANRNKKKHWFTCKNCGYQSNDDRVASMNIRNRAVVSRHSRETQGVCQTT
ncbi:MAG: RNA-guided endonuclease InsQ/TnpB family protein [Candidatus Hermodarchaeota archaeon]